VENPFPEQAGSGDRKPATFFGSDGSYPAVYKAAVIPHELTLKPQNSFPDPSFIYSRGKAGKLPIQTGS